MVGGQEMKVITMRNSSKIITAVAVAGIAFAGTAAFTGAGLTTSGEASQAQFIGGTVSQDVAGATLTDLTYGFLDGDSTQSQVNKVTLTFAAGATGKAVSTVLAATGNATFTCENIGASVADTSVCTVAVGSVDSFVTNVTKATVTVS